MQFLRGAALYDRHSMTSNRRYILFSYFQLLALLGVLMFIHFIIYKLVNFNAMEARDVWEAAVIGWLIAVAGYTAHLSQNHWMVGSRNLRECVSSSLDFDRLTTLLEREFGEVEVDRDKKTLRFRDKSVNRRVEVKWIAKNGEIGRGESAGNKIGIRVSTPHVRVVDVGRKNLLFADRIRNVIHDGGGETGNTMNPG